MFPFIQQLKENWSPHQRTWDGRFIAMLLLPTTESQWESLCHGVSVFPSDCRLHGGCRDSRHVFRFPLELELR